MDEPKFTKGPWVVYAELNVRQAATKRGIATSGFSSNAEEDVFETNKANMRLIAAAPELYEALQDCLREHGGFTIKGGCERRALAALAKARGEA